MLHFRSTLPFILDITTAKITKEFLSDYVFVFLGTRINKTEFIDPFFVLILCCLFRGK